MITFTLNTPLSSLVSPSGLCSYSATKDGKTMTIYAYPEDVEKVNKGVDVRHAMPYLLPEQYEYLVGFDKQERMDKEIYQSLRNQYEYILRRMIEPDRPRDKVLEDVKILLDVFNNTSKTAEELTGKIRRLEA